MKKFELSDNTLKGIAALNDFEKQFFALSFSLKKLIQDEPELFNQDTDAEEIGDGIYSLVCDIARQIASIRSGLISYEVEDLILGIQKPFAPDDK